MKKLLLAIVMVIGLSSPSYAWWDSYGGFTCGYMDPLTSFLDNIFGPPCPPPVAVAPVPVPVPEPVPIPVPGRPGFVPVPTPGPAYGPMVVPWYTPIPRY